jgi:uncharacterized RDD family membrane protein YckC/Tfp pilus assembly protein PilE
MYCMHCGKPLEAGFLTCQACGKPQTRLGGKPGEEVYGHFGRRFVAWFIDRVIVMLPLIVFVILADRAGSKGPGEAAFSYGFFAWLAFSILYYPLMESSRWQGTVGKIVMDLKVTHLNGERIGFLRALWRVVTSILSGLILGVGFLVAAFTERRQALHDVFASTLVVRRQFDAEAVKTAAPAESSGGALAIVVVVIGFGGVMMIGILAAISIPAYQDYLTRSRIAEAMFLARQAAMNVTEFTEQRKTPPSSLAEAGFTGTSQFVQSIALDPQSGAIRVVMAAPQMVAGKAFVLTPQREASGEIRWRCGTESVQERYLPRDCRRENR